MRDLWCVVLCGVVACGGDNGPSGPSVRFALPASGLPAPLAVPWPTDLYLGDADGTIVDTLTDWTLVKVTNPDPSNALANAYGSLDGFGVNAGALFSIDGVTGDDGVDLATLPSDPAAGADPSANVALIDVAAGTRVPCTGGWDPFTRVVVVMPEDPLAEGHTYAAIVTTGVKLASGTAIGPSSAFAAIRDGSRASAPAQLYGTAIDAATAAGIARDHIAGATVFTTQTAHRKLRKIRDALVAGNYGPAPSLLTTGLPEPIHYIRFGASAHPGWTATLQEWAGAARQDGNGQDLTGFPAAPEPSTTGVAHDSIGAVMTAGFVSPEFRRPFTMTADPNDGTIAYDASGNAVAYDANKQIPVSIILPKGPVPVAGFPVVIFQHGLGGDRSNAGMIANQLARAGIATVAIDAPFHGLRADGATDSTSSGKGTYTGPDGLTDSGNPLALVALSANLRNYSAADDNFWQAVLDLVQVRRLIGNCDLSMLADEYGATPLFDTSHVGLYGWSMGGEFGAIFSGVEPRSSVDPIVLQAPAELITHALVDSPVYAAQTTLLAAQAEVPEQTLDAAISAALIHLLQGTVDRADSTVFARDSDHDLWMFRGNLDESVPARWSNVLARAFGATQLTPTLGAVPGMPQGGSTLAGGHVVGFFEAAPGQHGFATVRFNTLNYEPPYPRDGDTRFVNLPNPVTIRSPVVGAQLAVVHFMQTTWAGAPEIKVDDPAFLGLLPVADADDDGYCDADETAAGTNPYDNSSHPSTTPNCVRNVGFSFP
jgi:dienelactone hydrolase